MSARTRSIYARSSRVPARQFVAEITFPAPGGSGAPQVARPLLPAWMKESARVEGDRP